MFSQLPRFVARCASRTTFGASKKKKMRLLPKGLEGRPGVVGLLEGAPSKAA